MVYDKSNKQSHRNLMVWLEEALAHSSFSFSSLSSLNNNNNEGKEEGITMIVINNKKRMIPIFVIATKSDLSSSISLSSPYSSISTMISSLLGKSSIDLPLSSSQRDIKTNVIVSGYDEGSFSDLTLEGSKLRSFFDHVIDLKFSPQSFTPIPSTSPSPSFSSSLFSHFQFVF